jgi:hypothetical protein
MSKSDILPLETIDFWWLREDSNVIMHKRDGRNGWRPVYMIAPICHGTNS